MRRFILTLLSSLLLFSLLKAQSPPTAQDEWAKPIKQARAFMELLQKSAFDSATALFDKTMKNALPADKLKSMWKTLQDQMGAFQEQGAIRTEKVQTYHVVYVTCIFKEGKLDAKIVINPKNKIAGLYFVPHREAGSYKLPDYVNPKAFTEIDTLKLPTTWRLPASLSLPNGAGPFPAIVLVHGSGPNDRDETVGPNKPFKDLALGLASRGIAVLRYEKRTHKYPNIVDSLKGQFTVMDETVDDALSAVGFLRNIEEIDPNRIVILGHSLGGTLVPRMAGLYPRLAGFIIMAGAARPLPVLMKEQYRYIFNLDGKISKTEHRKLNQLDSLIALITSPEYLNKANPTELILGAPPAYWKDLLQYDPLKYADHLRKPILVMQGGKDYQVTKKDFLLWKQHLQSDPKVVFKFYPHLNHLFMECKGTPSPSNYEIPAHVAPEVINDIARWVHRQFGK